MPVSEIDASPDVEIVLPVYNEEHVLANATPHRADPHSGISGLPA